VPFMIMQLAFDVIFAMSSYYLISVYILQVDQKNKKNLLFMINMMYRFIMYDIDDFFMKPEPETRYLIQFYLIVCGIFFLVVILNLFLAILFDSYDKVIYKYRLSVSNRKLVLMNV
jgi:hypothetical protein